MPDLEKTKITRDGTLKTGGNGPFVTLTRDGHRLSLSWPAPLPKPTVSGNSATYADVLSDVDLVVKATDTGFTHLLVVKTARAAANPMVRRASYRIGGDAALTMTPEGGLIAEANGVWVASAAPPVMWDTAKRQDASDVATPDVENEPAKMARVGSEISTGHLVLTPDASMLADPGARFPLVIDLLFMTGQNQWAYASAGNQNAPTTDSTIASGVPSLAAATLRVGNDPSSTYLIRSFMPFDDDSPLRSPFCPPMSPTYPATVSGRWILTPPATPTVTSDVYKKERLAVPAAHAARWDRLGS